MSRPLATIRYQMTAFCAHYKPHFTLYETAERCVSGGLMFRSLTLMIAVVFATLISAGTSYARDWVKLGDRHVGFISDHDTVEVGKHEGRFKRIRLAVKDNDIELTSVKV